MLPEANLGIECVDGRKSRSTELNGFFIVSLKVKFSLGVLFDLRIDFLMILVPGVRVENRTIPQMNWETLKEVKAAIFDPNIGPINIAMA